MACVPSFVLQDAFCGMQRAFVEGNTQTLASTIRKYVRVYRDQRKRRKGDREGLANELNQHLESLWLHACAFHKQRVQQWTMVVEDVAEALEHPLHRLWIVSDSLPPKELVNTLPFRWTVYNHHEQSQYVKDIVFAAFCASRVCDEGRHLPRELLHYIFEKL